MLPDAADRRLRLWLESGKGLKTIRDSKMEPSASSRESIPSAILDAKLDRGGTLQKLRLQNYPTIDVDRDKLFAGRIKGSKEDAKDKLHQLGYRNNPTAYVEVTEENGPDDGSFARQTITESGVNFDRPQFHNFPSLFKREKDQVHVCIWEVDGQVEFLAHRERSAWLQPMLHVRIPESKARVGVQDFRQDWYNEFDEELPAKSEVKWSVAH